MPRMRLNVPRKQGFRKSKGLGRGPSSHAGSVGKATNIWRNPRKPRTRKKKGWG